MKKILLSVSIIFASTFQGSAQKQISIFCDHVDEIARQEGITFREAAEKVKKLGYNGIDVPVTISDEKQSTLDALRFQHASAIVHIDFTEGDKWDEGRKALDFMKKHNYTRLLLVPGLLPKDADAEVVNSAYSRMDTFLRLAQSEGFDVMVEDYDNPRSICYNTEALDRIYSAVPGLNHVFDTGNYIYCGEDVMTALKHFQSRIHHVHLKDRKAEHSSESVAVGTGIAPMKDVVTELLKSGYNGWFTVENYGAKNMLEAVEISIANLNAIYEEFYKKYPRAMGMQHEMTEHWTPQPRTVTPGDASVQSAPSDAIVLFDGSSLDEWMSARGGAAEWDLHDGIMTVNKRKGDIMTRREFESFQLHLEWLTPENITGESQSRGNSGVLIAERYEIQILDSYENETYVNGQCGSIYKQAAPLVNAMRKPGEWNSFDIIYTAPVFKADGTYLYRPCVTVFHNGVLIQNNVEILGTTEWIGNPRVIKHGPGRIRIQSHGDPSEPLSFRNIWIREL